MPRPPASGERTERRQPCRSHIRRAIARPRPRRGAASALVVVGAPALVIALEDVRQRRLVDAGPVVAEGQGVRVAIDAQGRRRGVLDRVAHDVAADGEQRLPVGDERRPVGDRDIDPQRALRGPVGERVAHRAQAFAQGDRRGRIGPAGTRCKRRFGGRHDVVDGGDDAVDPMLRGGRERRLQRDQLGVGSDGGERRADFVVEVGGELALARHRLVDPVAKAVEGFHQHAGLVERRPRQAGRSGAQRAMLRVASTIGPTAIEATQRAISAAEATQMHQSTSSV